MLSGHHMWEKLCAQLQSRKEAEMEQKPPWGGYQQVEEAPYPMTLQEFTRWPREPGYKYELHDGRCVRLWRGPHGYCGGYGILCAYQPATGIYRIIVPELPGCEMERQYAGDDEMDHWNRNLEAGGEMVHRWMAAAWEAATTLERASVPVVPLPHVLEEPPEVPAQVHLKLYGVIPLETQADVDLAVAVLHALSDRVDGDTTHPLLGLLNALAEEVAASKGEQQAMEHLKALLALRIAEAERGEFSPGTMDDLLAEIHEDWKERLRDPKALPALEVLIEHALTADDAGQGIDLDTLIGPETLEQFLVSTAELQQGKRSQEWRKVLRHLWDEGMLSGPGRFANAEELLAEAKRRYLAAGEQHLKELVEEGLNSGPGILVDDAYWDHLLRKLEAEDPSEDHEAHHGT
jgi:hypothetical protein